VIESEEAEAMCAEEKRLVCDECGGALRIVQIISECKWYELPADGEPPEAREFIRGRAPSGSDCSTDTLEVECYDNYGHRTGWSVGASGYVERVEELTNDGP